MAVYTGTTQVNGYGVLVTQYTNLSTVFVRFPTVEPSLKQTRFYGEVMQLLPNFPAASLLSQIYYQKLWMDCVEINMRRDYGNYPTIMVVSWAVNGLPYEVHVV